MAWKAVQALARGSHGSKSRLVSDLRNKGEVFSPLLALPPQTTVVTLGGQELKQKFVIEPSRMALLLQRKGSLAKRKGFNCPKFSFALCAGLQAGNSMSSLAVGCFC